MKLINLKEIKSEAWDESQESMFKNTDGMDGMKMDLVKQDKTKYLNEE